MNKYKKTCKGCNTEFISSSPYKQFCSKECKLLHNSQFYSYTKCSNCKDTMRYFPNSEHKGKENIFCSNKCQGDWVRTNLKEERAQRANHMRKFRDNEKAWKKGLETRKENGNIITKYNWKQYWKRCNYLTRKIRKQMLLDWDGIDYIDGEYIRENLDLPYTHKNYPTLDHIIPRSECFKQGLTPDEATTPTNLKWTKRSNNSKKYNRYDTK